MEQSIALQVNSALKTFGGKEHRLFLPRFRKNGNGHAPNGKVTAVNHVSFEVERGEIFGILGPNGNGKSTLIRVIATLHVPDGGNITVFGHDVEREAHKVQTSINCVSVEASFFKKLSPMENLMYGARLYGVDIREAKISVREILLRLGLQEASI